MKKQTREIKGLKKLRHATGKVLLEKCDNCACARYSPCRCRRKREKEAENQDNLHAEE